MFIFSLPTYFIEFENTKCLFSSLPTYFQSLIKPNLEGGWRMNGHKSNEARDWGGDTMHGLMLTE
jgi:hypothetical protein